MYLFLNGILIRKDIDMSWRGIPLWNIPLILTTIILIYPSSLSWRHIKRIIKLILWSIPFWNTLFVLLMQNVSCGALLVLKWNDLLMRRELLFSFHLLLTSDYFKQKHIWAPSNVIKLIVHFRLQEFCKSCRWKKVTFPGKTFQECKTTSANRGG
jgi:hypothetical protein